MSWDIDLHCEHGCNRGSWNYTYNIAPMLSAAAEACGITWEGFTDTINGEKGDIGATLFRLLANELEQNRAKYELLNPSNGWGDRLGCIQWLREMAEAVPEFSPTVWSVT